MNRPPDDHIRRFMAAIRAEQCLVAQAAAVAGLTFSEAAEVWAYGLREGRLRLHDGGAGDRWIEEVKP